MSTTEYRIKINLEEFFQNEKKFSYILIKSNWKYVKDVKDHIKNLFSIKNISLVAEDIYLPVTESIKVINSNDIIKVVRKNCEKPENVIICDSIISNSVASNNNNLTNGDVNNFNPEDNLNSKQSCNNSIEILNKKLYKCENLLSNNETKTEVLANNTRQKRKRKHKREHKLDEEDNSNTPKKKIVTIIDDIKLNPFPLTKNRNHLKFDNDGNVILENEDKDVNTLKKKSECRIIFKNYLDDLPLVPRIITPIQNDNTTDVLKNNEQKSDNLNSHNFFVNDCNRIEVEPIQDTVLDISSVSCNGNGNNIENSINVNECLKFSKPLNALPVVGDILIFKIYRLNDKYEPCLSDYICGKVENIENDTNLIKLLIIEGQNQLKSVEGKFSMDSSSFNETDTFAYIKLDDMIDKNVFKI